MIRPTSVHAIAHGTTGSGKSLLLYWLERILIDAGLTNIKSTELDTEKRLRRFDDIQEWEVDTLRNQTIVLQEHMLALGGLSGREIHIRPQLPDELETDKHLYLSLIGPANTGKPLILHRLKMFLAEKGIINVEVRQLYPGELDEHDLTRIPAYSLKVMNNYTWYLDETQGAPKAIVPEPPGKFRRNNK